MNISYLTVSVGQEFGRGSAEGFRLGDSHMLALETSGPATATGRPAGTGRWLAHVVLDKRPPFAPAGCRSVARFLPQWASPQDCLRALLRLPHDMATASPK